MEETEANSLKIDEESVVKGHQEPEATLISDSLVPASVSHVEEAIDKLMKLSIQENMDSNNASMECNEKENVPLVKNGLRTPLKVRRKGRPPSTRRKSTLEKIIDKTKRSKRKVIKEEQDDPSQNGSQSLKKKKVPPKKKQPSSSSTTLHSLDELGTQESLMVNSNDNEVPVTGSRK